MFKVGDEVILSLEGLKDIEELAEIGVFDERDIEILSETLTIKGFRNEMLSVIVDDDWIISTRNLIKVKKVFTP